MDPSPRPMDAPTTLLLPSPAGGQDHEQPHESTSTADGPVYRPPGTADETAPSSGPRTTYRWATFGSERVMVAGDLLVALERP